MSEETKKLFLQNVIDPAEVIVKATGNPDLRLPLRKLYLERLELLNEVLKARYLDGFSESIRERVANLQEDLAKFKNAETIAAQIRRAESNQRVYSRTADILRTRQNFDELLSSRDGEPPEEIKEAVRAGQKTTDAFLAFNEDNLKLNDQLLEVEIYAKTHLTEKSVQQFRRRDFLRKSKRETLRFLETVVIIGVLAGYVVSESLKFFFSTNLVWLLFGVLAWNILKEYWLSQKSKKRRLEIERNDLLIMVDLAFNTEKLLLIGKSFPDDVNLTLGKSPIP